MNIPSSDLPQTSVPGGRMPPQNVEAEQSVLGTILLSDHSLSSVLELLVSNDFYKDSHKLIFEAMIVLFENNEPQDIITVSNLLKDQNNLDAAGGVAYLATLTSIVPVTANLFHYAKIQADYYKHHLRHLLKRLKLLSLLLLLVPNPH